MPESWIGASQPRSSSNRRSPLGNDSAMPQAPASNGCSQPKRPGPKWGARTLSSIPFPTHPSKSHNHCAAVLVAADISGATVQYRLLDTTRAYVLQKLIESDESEALARRHAEHHRDLFERAEAEWATRPGAE